MTIALIGSVSSSYHALSSLLSVAAPVCCVLGLDESQESRVCDYRSLRSLATESNLAFQSFQTIAEPTVSRFLAEHAPDQLWVIGLSQLVPAGMLQLARGGGVGFHPTWLPRGRGRAPVAWTILLEERAAATLFYLTEEPDAGDIIAQREVPVLPDDYAEDLIERTNQVLATLITDLAPGIREGTLPRQPQDHAQATYYAKRSPHDGLLRWDRSTDDIYRFVRAVGAPYPGAFSYAGTQKVTIRRAVPADEQISDGARGAANVARLGEVLKMDDDGLLVRTATGALRVTETQPTERGAIGVGTVLSASPSGA